MDEATDRLLLTRREAAEALGISVDTLVASSTAANSVPFASAAPCSCRRPRFSRLSIGGSAKTVTHRCKPGWSHERRIQAARRPTLRAHRPPRPRAPGALDDSFDDTWGTSQLFDQLAYQTLLLAWSFDEQIDGAPADLLELWRYKAEVAESAIAQIMRELGVTT